MGKGLNCKNSRSDLRLTSVDGATPGWETAPSAICYYVFHRSHGDGAQRKTNGRKIIVAVKIAC